MVGVPCPRHSRKMLRPAPMSTCRAKSPDAPAGDVAGGEGVAQDASATSAATAAAKVHVARAGLHARPRAGRPRCDSVIGDYRPIRSDELAWSVIVSSGPSVWASAARL